MSTPDISYFDSLFDGFLDKLFELMGQWALWAQITDMNISKFKSLDDEYWTLINNTTVQNARSYLVHEKVLSRYDRFIDDYIFKETDTDISLLYEDLHSRHEKINQELPSFCLTRGLPTADDPVELEQDYIDQAHWLMALHLIKREPTPDDGLLKTLNDAVHHFVRAYGENQAWNYNVQAPSPSSVRQYSCPQDGKLLKDLGKWLQWRKTAREKVLKILEAKTLARSVAYHEPQAQMAVQDNAGGYYDMTQYYGDQGSQSTRSVAYHELQAQIAVQSNAGGYYDVTQYYGDQRFQSTRTM